MKQNLIAIVGESGVGKTTLCQYIKNVIPTVVSYTTRPMRFNELDGREHWFVSPNEVPSKDDMLAYTKFGEYEYWTTIQQTKSLGNTFTYIIDEGGLLPMIEKFGDMYNIIKVRITRSDMSDDVDNDRMARDKGNFELPYSFYDIVLANDTSIPKLAITLLEKILTITNSEYESI